MKTQAPLFCRATLEIWMTVACAVAFAALSTVALDVKVPAAKTASVQAEAPLHPYIEP